MIFTTALIAVAVLNYVDAAWYWWFLFGVAMGLDALENWGR